MSRATPISAFPTGPRVPMDEVGVAAVYRHPTHLLGYALDLCVDAVSKRPSITPPG